MKEEYDCCGGMDGPGWVARPTVKETVWFVVVLIIMGVAIAGAFVAHDVCNDPKNGGEANER